VFRIFKPDNNEEEMIDTTRKLQSPAERAPQALEQAWEQTLRLEK
jgi:hypothetical protein